MSEFILQGVLTVLLLLPIIFSQLKTENFRRYDCVAGLIAQSVWFAYRWYIEAWSLYVFGVGYTGAFAYGFYTKWIATIEPNELGAKPEI